MSDLRAHLQAIYDEHGRLTPDLVVETARDEDHPLHSAVFDRPPEQAAEAWYRERAHELIQSVRVVYKRDDKPPLTVRAFHAHRDDEGYAYKPTDEVLSDPLLTRMVLADMQREWKTLKQRYDHFQEFRELVLTDMAQAS